jgi:hypothetical protein
LGENETSPVIISSKLNAHQECKLLQTLKMHKNTLGWTIADIKGISPLICTHKIYLEENAEPSREMQQRLNPNMKEVVKNEVIKAMFVSWNSLSGKPLSKLSCVCLSLRKLVNGKHFPVNGEYFPVNGEHFPVNEKHFSVNEKHFPVKEKFGLVSRKVFSLWLCLFSGKWFPGNHFPNFPVFVCH